MLIAASSRPESLNGTLQSIADCRRPERFSGVTVIDSSSDGQCEGVCKRPHDGFVVSYFRSTPRTHHDALHAAIETISDDSLIIFGTEDIRYTTKALLAYERAATHSGGDRFFGGPFACQYEVPPPSWLRRYLPLSSIGWDPRMERFDPRVDRFFAFNWAAHRRDILRLDIPGTHAGTSTSPKTANGEINLQKQLQAAGMHAALVKDAFVYRHIPHHRCSSDWTIQHAKRKGISRGLAHQQRPITDIALAHWGYTVRLITSTATKWLTSPLPTNRLHFYASYRQQKALGYFAGFRKNLDFDQQRAA